MLTVILPGQGYYEDFVREFFLLFYIFLFCLYVLLLWAERIKLTFLFKASRTLHCVRSLLRLPSSKAGNQGLPGADDPLCKKGQNENSFQTQHIWLIAWNAFNRQREWWKKGKINTLFLNGDVSSQELKAKKRYTPIGPYANICKLVQVSG